MRLFPISRVQGQSRDKGAYQMSGDIWRGGACLKKQK